MDQARSWQDRQSMHLDEVEEHPYTPRVGPPPRDHQVRPVRMTTGFEALLWSSASVNQEFELNEGAVITFQPHVPTDLDRVTKAELDEFYGGFQGRAICPRCNVTLAANGACAGFC